MALGRLLHIHGHVATSVVIHALGAGAWGCSILVGGHLVAVSHDRLQLVIGLLTADGDPSIYGCAIEAVPRVDGVIAAALGD